VFISSIFYISEDKIDPISASFPFRLILFFSSNQQHLLPLNSILDIVNDPSACRKLRMTKGSHLSRRQLQTLLQLSSSDEEEEEEQEVQELNVNIIKEI
jgi:hypothetical protein